MVGRGENITLLLPVNGSISAEDIRSRLSEHFKFEDNLKVETFRNPFRSYKLNKNLNFLKLIKTLKQRTNTVIFLRCVHYLPAAILSGNKVVFEIHNTAVHQGAKAFNFFLSRLLLRLAKRDNFVLFVSISERLKEYWIEKGIPAGKAVALHDGFDLDRYQSLPQTDEAKRMLGISPEQKLVVYSGNILANRGIDYIIQLAKCFPDTLFYVVGGPDELIPGYLKSMGSYAMKNVRFIGQVPHSRIVDYQAAADVLLAVWSRAVPTIDFCSPLKVFEYMAAGKPILAFGYPSVIEVLRNGENAFIAVPDNVLSLQEKLKEIFFNMDKARSIGQAARREACERYTWEHRAGAILDLLKNV
jgi:glycosyltransferase involved in cell wall biosynthesis